MWEGYPDGGKYLHSYELEGYDKETLWVYLSWFFLVDAVVYVYLLLPERNCLHRKSAHPSADHADRFMSMDSDVDENLLSSARLVGVTNCAIS